MEPHRFRRPAMLDPDKADRIPGDVDPALRSQVAHETASALIYRAGLSAEPEIRARMMRLVETEGIELVATLWSGMPASTLPGTLWRLFALLDWVERDPRGVSDCYRLGTERAEVEAAVAGAALPPGPDEVRTMAEQILSGAYDVIYLDVALERAAAFCRVMATGAAVGADSMEPQDEPGALATTKRAAALLGTAKDLAAAAALWRAGKLA